MDLHFFCHHESRVKAETEFADQFVGVFGLFEFFHELGSAGKRDLVDVFLDLVGRHANSAVTDGQGFLLFVELYFHLQVAEWSLVLTQGGQAFDLLRSIYCVGNQLPQEYFMIRIKKFFDDGEDILRVYGDGTFFLHTYRF